MEQGKVEIRWAQASGGKQAGSECTTSRHEHVAAYCRVSTDLDDQTASFQLQKKFYVNLIRSTPNWDFAGIYADEGITGTQRGLRPGFQRMIRRCEKGKIDRILCKSISRFARNTIDMLNVVRELKSKNIRVVFEKEGIDTLSLQSEFILSTIAAIAQDESRNISENMRWAFKKKFENGVPVFRRILGYEIERGKDGIVISVNEGEANIVREIYSLALSGNGYSQIARAMTEKGYRTVKGNARWTTDSVRGILKNERYTGDVLCQKTYTPDYLTHRCKRNNGQRPQYLIENHHAGIVSRKTFQTVQSLMQNNRKKRH